MNAKNKTNSRAKFTVVLRVLARSSEDIIVSEGLRIWDKLTEEERSKFATDPASGDLYTWRIARTIFCATGPEKLERQWAAEAIKPAIRAIKRIDKSRMS